MQYSIIKSELEPIIKKNNLNIAALTSEIDVLNLEISEKKQKVATLWKERDDLHSEQKKLSRYLESLTGLYYASIIIKHTGEPLGHLYHRSNQLNFKKLEQLVAEQKIYEVLHVMNLITTNRILCQRDDLKYLASDLADDLIILDCCIHVCHNLEQRFIKKYGSDDVFNLLKINLTEIQSKNISSTALDGMRIQRNIIAVIKQNQSYNDTQIDRLISKGGTKAYHESENFKIAQRLTNSIVFEEKKLKFYQVMYARLGISRAPPGEL